MRQTERVPGRLGRIVADRRRARFRALLSEVRTRPGMTVLDLGCGRSGRSTTDHAPHDWRITGIDRLPEAQVRHAHPGFRYVRGDACDLSAYADDAFDLVLAVGLLEHVVEPSAFLRASAEIRRVGRQYALVVPYRYAWIEPHYLVPLFPVLPRPVQKRVGARVRHQGPWRRGRPRSRLPRHPHRVAAERRLPSGVPGGARAPLADARDRAHHLPRRRDNLTAAPAPSHDRRGRTT